MIVIPFFFLLCSSVFITLIKNNSVINLIIRKIYTKIREWKEMLQIFGFILLEDVRNKHEAVLDINDSIVFLLCCLESCTTDGKD
jgi:hypothetical protein